MIPRPKSKFQDSFTYLNLLGFLFRFLQIHRSTLFSFDEDLLDHGLLQYLLLTGQVLLIEVKADLLSLQQGLHVVLNVEQHRHLLVLAQLQGTTRRVSIEVNTF